MDIKEILRKAKEKAVEIFQSVKEKFLVFWGNKKLVKIAEISLAGVTYIKDHTFYLCNLTVVTFKKTEGWYYLGRTASYQYAWRSISSTDLSNRATAAEVLSKYSENEWQRE